MGKGVILNCPKPPKIVITSSSLRVICIIMPIYIVALSRFALFFVGTSRFCCERCFRTSSPMLSSSALSADAQDHQQQSGWVLCIVGRSMMLCSLFAHTRVTTLYNAYKYSIFYEL